ncbi:NUDIX domain-containing protein [Brevibacillus migulae]|uniref:NUDIX domain-containing protein n=1 Tax=Brevibacillus migulae TaxID=1644114 RepID=UPI00106E55AC|nr:NUDIX domain-containing protein [Brevibacillus migulae]
MGQIRMRVSVVVVHEEKILLIQEESKGAVVYSLPGGGIEFQESIAVATKREVREETGMDVTFERLLWVDERIDAQAPGKHTVGIGVLAKLDPQSQKQEPTPGGVEGEQIVWAGWVSLEAFRTLPLDNVSRREQVWKALHDPQYVPSYIGNVL